MNNPIHIVVSTDSNYLIHTATLLKSISENHSGNAVYHVFSFELSDNEKKSLNKISDHSECIYYDFNNSILEQRLFKGQRLNGDRSFASFSRLLIPELLPDNISRCIYMDVDSIVLNDLNELININLDGYAIAGVLDTNPITRHYSVGLDDDDNYINSGMIVWNLDNCRKINVVDKFAKFIADHNGNVDAMDQETINGVLSKQTKILHPKSNVLTSFFQMDEKVITEMYRVKTYSNEEIQEAINSPIFVHFTPNFVSRPWIKGCKHPLAKKYWQYRRMIEPEGTCQKDSRPIKLKLVSSLFYLLPWRLFKIIFTNN